MMSSTEVPHELQAGRDRAHAEIAGALYKRAVDEKCHSLEILS